MFKFYEYGFGNVRGMDEFMLVYLDRVMGLDNFLICWLRLRIRSFFVFSG